MPLPAPSGQRYRFRSPSPAETHPPGPGQRRGIHSHGAVPTPESIAVQQSALGVVWRTPRTPTAPTSPAYRAFVDTAAGSATFFGIPKASPDETENRFQTGPA